jgi:hypothetical protein
MQSLNGEQPKMRVPELSKYTKIGILLMVCGLLSLGVEDIFLDESVLLKTLYLLPIACFFSGFVAFIFAAKNTPSTES